MIREINVVMNAKRVSRIVCWVKGAEAAVAVCFYLDRDETLRDDAEISVHRASDYGDAAYETAECPGLYNRYCYAHNISYRGDEWVELWNKEHYYHEEFWTELEALYVKHCGS